MNISNNRQLSAHKYLITVGAALMWAHAGIVNAIVVDLRTVNMTLASDFLSFDVAGTTATVSGHHVEYDATHDTATVYGPFSTNTVESSPSFLWPGFGRTTELGFSGATSIVTGLGLQASEALGQTDRDLPSGGIQPSLDNVPDSIGGLPSIQFALFTFASPVNVSQVIVDDAVNFGRAIWAAGGTTAPDLSLDFRTAFAGYGFRNSPDDAADGFFTHSFTPLQGIRYLAIGSPSDAGTVGDLGQVAGGASAIGFYIEGLNIAPVPLPAAGWLFVTGLMALLGGARMRSVA